MEAGAGVLEAGVGRVEADSGVDQAGAGLVEPLEQAVAACLGGGEPGDRVLQAGCGGQAALVLGGEGRLGVAEVAFDGLTIELPMRD